MGSSLVFLEAMLMDRDNSWNWSHMQVILIDIDVLNSLFKLEEISRGLISLLKKSIEFERIISVIEVWKEIMILRGLILFRVEVHEIISVIIIIVDLLVVLLVVLLIHPRIIRSTVYCR